MNSKPVCFEKEGDGRCRSCACRQSACYSPCARLVIAVCCHVLPCVFSVMHCNVSMESHTRTCVLFEAALAPTPTFSSVSFDKIAFAVACACACVVYVCKRACVCVRGGVGGGASQALAQSPQTHKHTHTSTPHVQAWLNWSERGTVNP